jgi:hypothetical protein
MGEALGEGQPRVKFAAARAAAAFHAAPGAAELSALSDLMARMERDGAIPVLGDGLVGGNCALGGAAAAAAGAPPGVLVSRTGKEPGARLAASDFVAVLDFDAARWRAAFRAPTPAVQPTSDTPLHFAALAPGAAERYGWAATPTVAVHGHALAEGAQLAAALAAGVPVSGEETLFSTPEDLAALEALFRERPYPADALYVRRGHGFFLLAGSVAEAAAAFERVVLPLARVRRRI